MAIRTRLADAGAYFRVGTQTSIRNGFKRLGWNAAPALVYHLYDELHKAFLEMPRKPEYREDTFEVISSILYAPSRLPEKNEAGVFTNEEDAVDGPGKYESYSRLIAWCIVRLGEDDLVAHIRDSSKRRRKKFGNLFYSLATASTFLGSEGKLDTLNDLVTVTDTIAGSTPLQVTASGRATESDTRTVVRAQAARALLERGNPADALRFLVSHPGDFHRQEILALVYKDLFMGCRALYEVGFTFDELKVLAEREIKWLFDAENAKRDAFRRIKADRKPRRFKDYGVPAGGTEDVGDDDVQPTTWYPDLIEHMRTIWNEWKVEQDQERSGTRRKAA